MTTDFGLDAAALGAIEAHGKAAGVAKAEAKLANKKAKATASGKAPRKGALDAQRAALLAGAYVPALVIASDANASYQNRADKLHEPYAEVWGKPAMDMKIAAGELEVAVIGGQNTYGKMLRAYRSILVESLTKAVAAGEDQERKWGEDHANALAAVPAEAKPHVVKGLTAAPAAPKAKRAHKGEVKVKALDPFTNGGKFIAPTPAKAPTAPVGGLSGDAELSALHDQVADAKAAYEAAKGTDGADEAKRALKTAQKRVSRHLKG